MSAFLVSRLRSLWRGVRRRDAIEADMRAEFEHHIELRTEHLMQREGLSRKEAYRRARLEFGHVEGHREDARASRGLRWFDELSFSWLDVKLGLRMLRKYPGLSLVSVVGMAVAIAIGAGGYALLDLMLTRSLPLPGGDRIVSIQNNTAEPGNPDRHVLHDFVVWRDELDSVRDVGAFTGGLRNLILPDGGVSLVRVARMTASGFRVAQVPPILGRYLLDSDEESGAPPVLVIAYEEWQRHFDGDPDIVGRQVRLGTRAHTVVGVMPAGYRFPLAHRYWVPLRLDPGNYPRGAGPALHVFGRLREGASLSSAQAELATLGARLSAEYPETNAGLRPRVLPYPYPFTDVDSPEMAWLMRGFRLMVGLLLVVVAVNVAMLVYARTAARSGEIAVRGAIGASRRRVVTQLFAEALVLSLLAAAIGLGIAAIALDLIRDMLMASTMGGELPFWIDFSLSAETVLYTAGLAVVAGIIVGVLPALKATRVSLQAGLQQIATRGSRMQLGRTWTAMIVVQVALAVAILPYALMVAGHATRHASFVPGYPADQILRSRLTIEREETPPPGRADAYERELTARYQAGAVEVLRRLAADPAVAGVSHAHDFPGEASYRHYEVEGTGATSWARDGAIAADLLDVLDVQVMAGRELTPADTLPGSNTVLVDREFVESVLGGGAAIGRRVREVRQPEDPSAPLETGPWLEVVGVVPTFTTPGSAEGAEPGLYRAVGLSGARGRLQLVVRTSEGTLPTVSGRLRAIAAAVDPALQIYDLRTAASVEREKRKLLASVAAAILAVTLSVLLLSAAGIYAMISFTVARRRREIGIRSALGASRRRVLGGIFARAAAQIGAGVAGGLVLILGVDAAAGGGLLEGRNLLLLPAVIALMATLGLVASLGPARQALGVQPTEALREE